MVFAPASTLLLRLSLNLHAEATRGPVGVLATEAARDLTDARLVRLAVGGFFGLGQIAPVPFHRLRNRAPVVVGPAFELGDGAYARGGEADCG